MAKKQEDIVTPTEYKNNHFGKVLASFDVIKKDGEVFAVIFSEGSISLKKLLLQLWAQNIETIACCTGHTMQTTYTKKTFWGEKHIRECEFLKNQNNKKYHWYIASRPGYLSFKLKNEENTSAIAHQIENLLKDKCPGVPCHVAFGMTDIGIYMDHAVSKQKIEDFFSAVSDAIDQSLDLQKSVSIKNAIDNA